MSLSQLLILSWPQFVNLLLFRRSTVESLSWIFNHAEIFILIGRRSQAFQTILSMCVLMEPNKLVQVCRV
jgi:hypothetical protein